MVFPLDKGLAAPGAYATSLLVVWQYVATVRKQAPKSLFMCFLQKEGRTVPGAQMKTSWVCFLRWVRGP